jgi:hypothetical protein
VRPRTDASNFAIVLLHQLEQLLGGHVVELDIPHFLGAVYREVRGAGRAELDRVDVDV